MNKLAQSPITYTLLFPCESSPCPSLTVFDPNPLFKESAEAPIL